jgi:hypothetical protein
MSTIYINILCALITVTSNTLIKYILNGKLVWKGEILTFVFDLLYNFKNPLLILALLIFITGNMLWIFIISTQNFSFALPLQIALVFLFNILISFTFFNESITLHYTLGVFFIFIGITLVTTSNSFE